MQQKSDINILADFIDEVSAVTWIRSAYQADWNGWRNKYNETIAQVASLPTNDNFAAILELLPLMSNEALNNRDNDDNILITSCVYYPLVVKRLLAKGIDPETRNGDGITLFSLVAELGEMDLLISLNEDYKVEVSDKESDSALVLASMNNKDSAVTYLLAIGVDLEDHFLKVWGKHYLPQLKEYNRLDEYYDILIKNNLLELVPSDLKDVFLF